MSALPPFVAAFLRFSRPVQASLIALTAAAIALSVRLWPEWRHNPDLSHGLFMPVVFLLLLHESQTAGRRRYLRPRPAFFAALALSIGGLFALGAAGLYAATVDWSHPLVNLSLTLAFAFFVAAAVVTLASDSVRLMGINWIAFVAILLWLLCTPIPPGTYSRLTLGLQLWVSENVLRTLHVLGIPAIRHGNIIELARTAVGVEEACSGVRSLISCLFAGLFFSATLVRRPWARALIIALAAPLALGMNFLRSLALTLLANSGIDIAGVWHDATGFAVLGVTAAILGGLALALERRPKPDEAAVTPHPPLVARPALAAQRTLSAALVLAAILIALFIANTHRSVRGDLPVPDLLALVPPSADGWQVRTMNLYEFVGTLQTDHLAQRSYVRRSGPAATEITIYVAYWRAGQAPVSLVASHTPDACWPGAGWSVVRTPEPRVQLRLGQRTLADAEYRLFRVGEYPQHVWFWHIYDGRPISYRDPYSAIELLRIAWRYGFRREGDQMFVRVSSNRPWSEISPEPLVTRFFAEMRPLGL